MSQYLRRPWLMTLVSMCAVSALTIAAQTGPPVTSSEVEPDAQTAAITDEIVRDLCGKQVVQLAWPKSVAATWICGYNGGA